MQCFVLSVQNWNSIKSRSIIIFEKGVAWCATKFPFFLTYSLLFSSEMKDLDTRFLFEKCNNVLGSTSALIRLWPLAVRREIVNRRVALKTITLEWLDRAFTFTEKSEGGVWAVASMAAMPMVSNSSSSSAALASSGARALQCPHHGAKNSTRRCLSLSITSDWKLELVRVTTAESSGSAETFFSWTYVLKWE